MCCIYAFVSDICVGLCVGAAQCGTCHVQLCGYPSPPAACPSAGQSVSSISWGRLLLHLRSHLINYIRITINVCLSVLVGDGIDLCR